ncbi:MAG TPA: choice-of-anchor tandem repeat GloVer-containing protein [Candidatus Cybelea sp.]|nr:choice-of-anchor tandem repeat GloVer-containing protein [Candidatus Cybelea sp.]
MPYSSASPGSASGFQVLFGFGGNRGEYPGDLTAVNAQSGFSLYGTTFAGGTYNSGTVFNLQTDGKERVLYDFSGGQKGTGPSPLTRLNGTFYGVTAYTELVGGQLKGGTVFAVNKSGKERTLYVFQDSPDGSLPVAKLTALNGILYGTTQDGGTSPCPGLGNDGCGIVFATTITGQERVLYSFKGAPYDGAIPESSLLYHNERFYSTTTFGGSGGCYNSDKLGCGTVFSITPSGQEHVLHSFTGGTDGAYPLARLVNVSGTLYGTTEQGGTNCYGAGCGTVFSITPRGKETVIYTFKGGSDGKYPFSGLTLMNGTLYGTTEDGGGAGCQGQGCGTIFSVTTTGKEQILYRFSGNPPDGKFPESDLTLLNGALYGTTDNGGARHHGIAFEITP